MDKKLITLDGPSGVGKGTASQGVAAALNWRWLDSGALYRLVAYAAQQKQTDIEDESALVDIAAGLDVSFELAADHADVAEILLEGECVTQAIRHNDIGMLASKVSVFPTVRAALLQRQRDFLTDQGLVADGRDMGTVVFPEAPLKFFLTASAEVRAERRHKQLLQQGLDVSMARVLQEVQERDARDMNRAVAPLKPAEDAVIVDTSTMTVAEVRDLILNKARQIWG